MSKIYITINISESNIDSNFQNDDFLFKRDNNDAVDFEGVRIRSRTENQAVTFKCSYPMTVDISSAAFDVETVSINGAESDNGKLDTGFQENVKKLIHSDDYPSSIERSANGYFF